MDNTLPLPLKKNIALIAHDKMKDDLVAWVDYNKHILQQHHLFGTGTTAAIIERDTKLPIYAYKSGPFGGDQQIGAKISEDKIHLLIFFWDPMEAQPHDPDVKALLRLATVWNIPMATNRATADFIISSTLMNSVYTRLLPYQQRTLDDLTPW